MQYSSRYRRVFGCDIEGARIRVSAENKSGRESIAKIKPIFVFPRGFPCSSLAALNTLLDCSQPSIFSYFHSIADARRESRENWTPVQNGRLDSRFAGKPQPPPHVLRAPSLAFSFACVNREAVNSLNTLFAISQNSNQNMKNKRSKLIIVC